MHAYCGLCVKVPTGPGALEVVVVGFTLASLTTARSNQMVVVRVEDALRPVESSNVNSTLWFPD